MTSAAKTQQVEATASVLPRSTPLVLWLLSGLLLLAAIGQPPITRTQEARVLETARQMLGSGWRGWIIPHLNGEPRLQKPPLAYWLTAAFFMIGGVSEGVGRIPAAIAGWLTLWLVFRFARDAFDQRVALASAAALLGSLMFFRFARWAETDTLVMLFLTLAIYALWRSTTDPRAIWMHTFAFATAMVVLSKGAPVLFALIFLLALCWIERRWDIARRFVLGGAILTFLAVAAPWFIYVRFHQDASIFLSELKTAGAGEDHFGWPWLYIPGLALGCAPWTALLPLALIDAARRWRAHSGVRFTSLWLLSILVPLCINGNKQDHYLVPLTPAMMILVAQLLVDCPKHLEGWVRWIFFGMLGTAFVVAAMVPIIAHRTRGHNLAVDWVLMTAICAVSMVVIVVVRRRSLQAGVATLLALVCTLMPLVIGLWEPTLKPRNVRDIAHDIRAQFGNGPYIFYGSEVSLSLCFQMRCVIPSVPNEAALAKSASPATVVLIPVKRDRPAPHLPPPPFVFQRRLDSADQTFELYAYPN